ncbi:MAG: hypothetical protein FWE93_04325, partial [Alphaproteobacteria bacterium]|nr:hypothetical protein [Alphaproteobacteria bacterium]
MKRRNYPTKSRPYPPPPQAKLDISQELSTCTIPDFVIPDSPSVIPVKAGTGQTCCMRQVDEYVVNQSAISAFHFNFNSSVSAFKRITKSIVQKVATLPCSRLRGNDKREDSNRLPLPRHAFTLFRRATPSPAKGNTLSLIVALGLTLITSTAMAEEKPLCKVGTVANLVQTGTTWTWTCEGIHGGKSKSCAPKINGKCGDVLDIAAQGLAAACKKGIMSSQTETTPVSMQSTLSWKCDGINGGTDAACSAPKCYKTVTTCLGTGLGSPAGINGCSGTPNPYTQTININYEMAGGG